MKVLVIASEPISAGCIPERGDSRLDPSFWRDSLARYAEPDVRRSMLDVATSAVPYVALSALMYLARDVSSLLVLVIAVPAAGFLMRTFVVFHDCAHGSFLPSRRANAWLGTACGLLVYSPFTVGAMSGSPRHLR